MFDTIMFKGEGGEGAFRALKTPPDVELHGGAGFAWGSVADPDPVGSGRLGLDPVPDPI
jgi:hypothetical protein